MSKEKRIGLINFEGDCLYAIKTNPEKDVVHIVVYDQTDSLCEVFTSVSEFLAFIDGREYVTDSDGRKWVYTDEHRDAKPTTSRLFEFLNS